MASAPQPNLPLFYKDLMPLNSRDHGTWRAKSMDSAPWLVGQHAIPLTVEEFPQAQRHFPIIFASGDNPVPLALMGLNEGVNVFVNEEGKIDTPIYLPAYVRRYPFLLAKLTPIPRNCRCASIRRAIWSATSRKATCCSKTTSRARRPRTRSISARVSSRPVSAPARSSRSCKSTNC